MVFLRNGLYKVSKISGGGMHLNSKQPHLENNNQKPNNNRGLGQISAKLANLIVKPLAEKSKPKNISFTM